jgi:hypothetical protein
MNRSTSQALKSAPAQLAPGQQVVIFLCRLGQLNTWLCVVDAGINPSLQRATMEQAKQPSDEVIKRTLERELEQRKPQPDQKQIRRELGWDLVKLERGEPDRR